MAYSDRSRENATFAACLAEILRDDLPVVPAASEDLGLDAIGYWLAAKNLALVPVLDPQSFQWAGLWIARLANGDGYVVMAGTPSDVASVPQGVEAGGTKNKGAEVIEGWVVAAPAQPFLFVLPRKARFRRSSGFRPRMRQPNH